MTRNPLHHLALTATFVGAAALFTAIPTTAEANNAQRHLGNFGAQQHYRQLQRQRGHGMAVPELDPSSGATGLALLVGGAALIMRRRKRA